LNAARFAQSKFTMKSFRLFLLLASAAISARADWPSLFTNVTPAVALADRPSIILIQCHDLARGDLSCYGQTNFQTPNLDRLAAEGVRFTDYSGGADVAATTALALSGKISGTATNESNLAQVLRQNGYHTGFIGEWELPGKPWDAGFDEFAGFLDDAAARDYFADALWRYAPDSIFDQANARMNTFVGKEMIYANTGGKKGTYLPELLINAMVNFVRVNEPDDANHHRPFFLVVNFPAPRSAIAGADDFPVPTDAPFTDEAWSPAAKNRAALLTRLDTGISRLFEQLAKNKQTNSAAVFFTSSAAPEKFADKSLATFLPAADFAATNHPTPCLPMLMRYPSGIRGGQVSHLKWSAADLPATVLDLSHSRAETNFGGTSVVTLLREKPQSDSKNSTDLPAANPSNLPTGQ
jgi:arylsulfatase A-like enzyme